MVRTRSFAKKYHGNKRTKKPIYFTDVTSNCPKTKVGCVNKNQIRINLKNQCTTEEKKAKKSKQSNTKNQHLTKKTGWPSKVMRKTEFVTTKSPIKTGFEMKILTNFSVSASPKSKKEFDRPLYGPKTSTPKKCQG